MLEISDYEKRRKSQLVHDINASISALQGAVEVIKDEWRANPELVDRIIPLTAEKINQLQQQMENFRNSST